MYRPGTLRATSTRLVAPCSVMSSELSAATENGTSCNDTARLVAVTMTSSIASSS
jgi:hypothetical protein